MNTPTPTTLFNLDEVNKQRHYGMTVRIGPGRFRVVYPEPQVASEPRVGRVEMGKCCCLDPTIIDPSGKCWTCWAQEAVTRAKTVALPALPFNARLSRDKTKVESASGALVSDQVYLVRLRPGVEHNILFIRFIFNECFYHARCAVEGTRMRIYQVRKSGSIRDQTKRPRHTVPCRGCSVPMKTSGLPAAALCRKCRALGVK